MVGMAQDLDARMIQILPPQTSLTILAHMAKLLETAPIEVSKTIQVSGTSEIQVSKMNQVSEATAIQISKTSQVSERTIFQISKTNMTQEARHLMTR